VNRRLRVRAPPPWNSPAETMRSAPERRPRKGRTAPGWEPGQGLNDVRVDSGHLFGLRRDQRRPRRCRDDDQRNCHGASSEGREPVARLGHRPPHRSQSLSSQRQSARSGQDHRQTRRALALLPDQLAEAKCVGGFPGDERGFGDGRTGGDRQAGGIDGVGLHRHLGGSARGKAGATAAAAPDAAGASGAAPEVAAASTTARPFENVD
jgi:hypothetical protein